MTALVKMTQVEAKLFVRDRVSAPLTIGLPVVLLVAFGLIPGFSDPNPDLSGQTGTELIAAIGVGLTLAMLGLSVLPTTLSNYRERGILRRLGASPVHPRTLLTAQLLVYVAAAVVSVVLLLAVGTVALDLPLPDQLAGFALSMLLGIAALFTVGLLIAAVASSTRAANAISMTLFFPSLFLAGVYVPLEAMPSALRHISDFTPLGAALQSVRDSWSGHLPSLLHIGTMAGYAVLAGVAAARYFRWE
jgi:ABC-2 type transport system permease protein